jgi:hypothetical protein
MKKSTLRLLVVLLAVSLIIVLLRTSYETLKSYQQDSLVGKWRLENNQSLNNQFTVVEMVFIDPDILILRITDNGYNSYNIEYQYVFLEKSRIKITAPRRISSEWEYIVKDDTLVVNSGNWPGGTSIFRRGIVYDWPSISVLLGICIAGIFFITLPKLKLEYAKQDLLIIKPIKISKSNCILKYIMVFLLVTGGIILGIVLWSWPFLPLSRPPWDAVVTLELSAFFLLLVIRTIRANHEVFIESVINWFYCSGIFLLSICTIGTIVSSVKILIFVVFGSYL